MRYITYLYYALKAKVVEILYKVRLLKYRETSSRPLVDSSTLHGKVMMGYQGWFGYPGDGSELNSLFHWDKVDLYPDVSEIPKEQQYVYEGKAVYSAYSLDTVMTHFKWMAENNLDGVFLQRFVSELSIPSLLKFRNKVTSNVVKSSQQHGRVFSIMYDITGADTETLFDVITKDWAYVTFPGGGLSSNYLRHSGKRVVGLWGFGFTSNKATPELATQVIKYFKDSGCTVVGGVPTHWRTLTEDAQANPAWKEVYELFDVISPWTVGRYYDDKTADAFTADNIIPDMKVAKEYMPVIFPGYSAHKLNGTPFDQIPRRNGDFYMNQARNSLMVGCKMIYVAMYDECDEGTAIYKLADKSDRYLKLTNDIGQMLRGEK